MCQWNIVAAAASSNRQPATTFTIHPTYVRFSFLSTRHKIIERHPCFGYGSMRTDAKSLKRSATAICIFSNGSSYTNTHSHVDRLAQNRSNKKKSKQTHVSLYMSVSRWISVLWCGHLRGEWSRSNQFVRRCRLFIIILFPFPFIVSRAKAGKNLFKCLFLKRNMPFDESMSLYERGTQHYQRASDESVGNERC